MKVATETSVPSTMVFRLRNSTTSRISETIT